MLAIREFNERSEHVKIDRWYGVANGRPFPERHFLTKMFVAHDLRAGATAAPSRGVASLALDDRH